MHAVGYERRHAPFVATLAAGDETSVEWRAVKSGYLTLRLLDVWLADGPRGAAIAEGCRAVAQVIDDLPPGNAERHLLANLLAAIGRAPDAAIAHVAAPLLAYGCALQLRAAWALAGDVFGIVLAECMAVGVSGGSAALPLRMAEGDSSAGTTAALRLASCMRQLGDHARAAEAYAVAECLGASTDNVYAVLMAQLGHAKLTVERGNLPAAEAECDAVIDAATRAGVLDVRAQACYERAHVAHRRGHHALAVSLAYEAWKETTDPAERDRVLTGLATSLAEVGQREAARDANLLLAAQARDPSTRWVATINLLELAAQDGREVEFTRLRRALEDVDLPPMLAGYFHYYVAQGYQTFGQPVRAEAEYDRTIAIATRHGLNGLLIQAEDAKRTAAAPTTVPTSRAVPTRDRGVTSVAAAIRGARQLAGITG